MIFQSGISDFRLKNNLIFGFAGRNSDFKIHFWPFFTQFLKFQDDWRASGSFLHTIHRLARLRQLEPAMTDGRAYITKRWEKFPHKKSIQSVKKLFLWVGRGEEKEKTKILAKKAIFFRKQKSEKFPRRPKLPFLVGKNG